MSLSSDNFFNLTTAEKTRVCVFIAKQHNHDSVETGISDKDFVQALYGVGIIQDAKRMRREHLTAEYKEGIDLEDI